jgi:hypothetical protein
LIRLLNRLLAALLSLALIVIGVLVVVEVVAQRLGKHPVIADWHPSYDWARRTEWQQGSVRVTCIVLAVAGLLLLALELKRSRPSRLTVDSGVADTAYTRRGVAAAVGKAVGDVDGINSTRVKVKRRKVRVAATTAGLQPYTAEALTEPATAAAQQRLDALELRPAPVLSMRVTTGSR